MSLSIEQSVCSRENMLLQYCSFEKNLCTLRTCLFLNEMFNRNTKFVVSLHLHFSLIIFRISSSLLIYSYFYFFIRNVAVVVFEPIIWPATTHQFALFPLPNHQVWSMLFSWISKRFKFQLNALFHSGSKLVFLSN